MAHKPSFWLFEGQDVGKHSAKSIHNIFRTAVSATGVNPWATVHTLRHLFTKQSELVIYTDAIRTL